MQELIKVEKRVVGAEEVNSVSARELHVALGIKKQHSNWITAQIDRAGLQANVDYIIVSKKVEAGKGVSTRKEYIITTDASKHIAMMSQGQKAKEVRDYFIAVEKEFNAKDNLHVELDQLIPAVKTMVNMMSMMLQSQTKMMEMMQELMQQQAQTKNLTPEQLGKLRGAINLAAIPIGEFFSQSSASEVKKCIYTNLNNRLGVPSYIYIPNHAMDEAITFISHLEDKYIAKNKNVEDMNVDIYKESKV